MSLRKIVMLPSRGVSLKPTSVRMHFTLVLFLIIVLIVVAAMLHLISVAQLRRLLVIPALIQYMLTTVTTQTV